MKRMTVFLQIIVLTALSFFAIPRLFSQIVINEILYDPSGTDTGKEWIELYNPTNSSVDMNGWELDCDEAPYFLFGDFILHAHSYVVIHLRAEGTNSNSDFYTGASWSSENMGNSHGQVTLFKSSSHTVANLVDYVEWGAISKTHESRAISANQWPDPPNYAPHVNAGHSIAYDGTGNSGTDWRDEETPSPGSDNSLPVFLSSFSATPQEKSVLIRWSTQSEVNTLGFYILRSADPKSEFAPISDLIRGNGNTTVVHHYQFIDRDVQPEITYYYRLKDVDFNGNVRVHGVVSACVTGQQESPCAMPEEFQLSEGYPNPFGPGVNRPEIYFKLLLPQNKSEQIEADIWNVLGQKIARIKVGDSRASEYSLLWNGLGENYQPVPAGVYFLRVRQGQRIQIRRLLLVR